MGASCAPGFCSGDDGCANAGPAKLQVRLRHALFAIQDSVCRVGLYSLAVHFFDLFAWRSAPRISRMWETCAQP